MGEPADSPDVGVLLRDALRRFDGEMGAARSRTRAAQLRPSHNLILRHLDPRQGTRASDLAARAGITRQAVTQVLDDLERIGIVERRPDPDDGRAKLVAYTPRGREAYAARRRIAERLEARWRQEVGPRRYDALRAVLQDLAED